MPLSLFAAQASLYPPQDQDGLLHFLSACEMGEEPSLEGPPLEEIPLGAQPPPCCILEGSISGGFLRCW